MNREELKDYIGITAFSLGHIEKDYFQHIVLSALSRKWSSPLVFKGGTALQKIGLTARFSEDLDFTEKKDISTENISDTIKKAISSYNYPLEIDRFSDKEISVGFRVKIQGPLYRNNHGSCSIRLEISRREKVLLRPSVEEINPIYKDIIPYIIKVMDKNEIAAEKVRAILTRDKARDLYDLYKLIENNVDFNIDLIDKKLKYYDRRFDSSAFIKRCKELSKRWDKDLGSLMKNIPSKNKALEIILSEVKTNS